MAGAGCVAENSSANAPRRARRSQARCDPEFPLHAMEGQRQSPTDPIHVAGDLDASDRRSFARYRVRGQWQVRDLARGRVIGSVCDIGLGGLRIQAPEPLPPARRYALAVDISHDEQALPPIEVIARCAWHRARPDLLFEAGFEFVEMTPAMRERVAQYIDRFGY